MIKFQMHKANRNKNLVIRKQEKVYDYREDLILACSAISAGLAVIAGIRWYWTSVQQVMQQVQ